MIQSALLRLTLSYLAIIMVISLCFSAALYQVSRAELQRAWPPPQSYLGQFGRLGMETLEDYRSQQVERGQRHLQRDLLLLNLGTLLAGGGVSFLLARRNLRPIEEAMEAQGRFTADASHELRTPLAAMQTEIEVALRDPKLTTKESKELLRSNLEEIAKLKALAEGLLRLARSDHERSELVPVSLTSAVEAAVKRVRPAALAKDITITNSIDEELVVSGDLVSLVELVVILTENAIKYSNSKTTIEVVVQARGRQALIEVRDQGFGIKASDIPHIFDRFYRADPARSKTTVDGYGLGLSIARSIVDMHRGSLDVRSTYGEGSVFSVQLPLARSDA